MDFVLEGSLVYLVQELAYIIIDDCCLGTR